MIFKIASIVVRFEWLFLIAISPFLLFPTPSRTIFLLVLPILWGSRKLVTKRFFDRTPFDWLFFTLSLMLLVSLYATYDLNQSLTKIIGMLFGVALFFVIVQQGQHHKSWLIALIGFITAGAGVAGLGMLGMLWIDKFVFLRPVTSRLPGVNFALPGAEAGFHPNEIAGALLWVAPMTLIMSYIAVQYRGRIRSSLGALRAGFILIASFFLPILVIGMLILTQSRGGLIAFMIVVLSILLIVVRNWVMTRPASHLMMLAVVAGLLAVAIFFIQRDSLENLTSFVFGAGDLTDGALSLNSLEGRIELWSRAIYGIQDFAFTGMGMNTFRKIVPILYPLFLISPEVDISHAHNAFLQVALDLGITGLVAYLAIYIAAFAMLVKLWREQYWITFERPLIRAIILGLGGGLAGHLLYGMTDAIALGAKPGLLWWWLLGLIAALYRLQEKQEEQVTGRTGNRKDR